MNPYISRKNELKARLADEMKDFTGNPSAFNYDRLDNTMLLYQDHIKNVDPDTYNNVARVYEQEKA
jgi:hypothetical protein